MAKDEAKNDIFNKLQHISTVVKTAEKAQKYYRSIGNENGSRIRI